MRCREVRSRWPCLRSRLCDSGTAQSKQLHPARLAQGERKRGHTSKEMKVRAYARSTQSSNKLGKLASGHASANAQSDRLQLPESPMRALRPRSPITWGCGRPEGVWLCTVLVFFGLAYSSGDIGFSGLPETSPFGCCWLSGDGNGEHVNGCLRYPAPCTHAQQMNSSSVSLDHRPWSHQMHCVHSQPANNIHLEQK